jgi:hypothetical protein
MHFLLAWRVIATDDAQRQELSTAFIGLLRGEAYVEAFPGAVIVQIFRPEDRSLINERLVSWARKRPASVQFLAGPAIEEGIGYSGWLPKSSWREIDRRARPATYDRWDELWDSSHSDETTDE